MGLAVAVKLRFESAEAAEDPDVDGKFKWQMWRRLLMIPRIVTFCWIAASCSLARPSLAETPSGAVSLPQLKNRSTGLCLDSYGRTGPVMMNTCHGKRGNEEWSYDLATGVLKNPSSGLCLDAHGKDDQVVVSACLGSRAEQSWVSDAKRGELRNKATGQCLDSAGRLGPIQMVDCSGQRGNQEWSVTGDGALGPACAGAVVDLAAATKDPSCSTDDGDARRPSGDEALELKLTALAGKAPPGGTATLTAVMTNRSAAPLRLVLPVSAASTDVIVELTAVDAAGASTETPMNKSPCPPISLAEQLAASLPDGVVGVLGPLHRGVQVELPPDGSAQLALTWRADGVKWGPARTRRGKCEAAQIAAPLRPGTYIVTARFRRGNGPPLSAHVEVVVGR